MWNLIAISGSLILDPGSLSLDPGSIYDSCMRPHTERVKSRDASRRENTEQYILTAINPDIFLVRLIGGVSGAVFDRCHPRTRTGDKYNA